MSEKHAFAVAIIILELQTGDKSYSYLRNLLEEESVSHFITDESLKNLVIAGLIRNKQVFISFENRYAEVYSLTSKAEAKPKKSLYAGQDNIFGKPIFDTLPFTIKVANIIRAQGADTIGDLVSLKETDLLKMNGMGKGSLNEVKLVLSDIGLRLGMTSEEINNFNGGE